MLQKFVIQPNGPQPHSFWPNFGYPRSHPHWWLILDKSGNKGALLSQRDDYAAYSIVTIDAELIPGSHANYYLDKSPARTLVNSNIPSPPPPPDLGVIDSDVIVTVHAIETKNKLTIISGSIFYFDPKLKNLTGSLRSEFREKAAISVTTNLKSYDFSHGNTYIFPNLRDVSVTHHRIHATDARMPRP